MRFIALHSAYDRTQDPIQEEKSVKSPAISPLKPATGVLPGESIEPKNWARWHERLTTMSAEADLRFNVLLSAFDHTQDPDPGGKVGEVT